MLTLQVQLQEGFRPWSGQPKELVLFHSNPCEFLCELPMHWVYSPNDRVVGVVLFFFQESDAQQKLCRHASVRSVLLRRGLNHVGLAILLMWLLIKLLI